MLIDARVFPDGSVVRSDVTVVGAGPAGIVLSLELALAGYDVMLVESGETRFSPTIQDLGDTPYFDARVHAPMSEATRRQIGGASNIWGGRCVPYDPVDFDERSYIPYSSWPVRYEDLEPHFQRAAEYFFCGDAQFDLRRIPSVKQKSIVPGLPDAEILTSTLERWSLPTNFGKEYRRELESSRRVRLVYGLTCTEIECDDSKRSVTALRAATLGSRNLRLESRAYVLACGGLETTRLLLASDQRHPGGIGNDAGHLGRFYMGHISGRIARVHFTTPPEKTVFAFDRDPSGVYLRRRFSFSRDFLHQEKLPNIVAWLANPDIWNPSHGSGVLSFAYLALTSPWFSKYFAPEAIRKSATGDLPERVVWPHIRNALRSAPSALAFIVTFGYRRFIPWRKIPGFFTYSASNIYPLHYHGEQVPNPESRVSLAKERDALGTRKLQIDLRFTQQDVDGVLRAHRYWDAYLRRYGCGQLEYTSADIEASVWEQASDGFHQAGTTRMSARPENGVVGPSCNVHGFDNLFVLSSSIFVTSGQANSTFMIVAFGLRLAEHLRRAVLR